MKMVVLLIVALLASIAWAAVVDLPKPGNLPNIVVILTDDQDDISLSIERALPQTRRLLVERGVRFTHAFANTPVCCPSRATLLTGRYPHAPGMTKSNRVNCGGSEWRDGPELDTVAVRMQQRGYRTMYAGKYLNSYGTGGDTSPSDVPAGWNEWYALVGNSRYWNYSVSDEGVEVKFGSINGGGDYLTDNLARRANKFIRTASKPFMMWVAPPAAHAPFAPAMRHIGTWSRVSMFKSPAFNASVEGKHEPVGIAKALSRDQVKDSEEIYRSRGEALQSVDDLVVTIVAALKDRGVDNQTFIIFTSDNGFHLGEFRLGFDKRQPYETDIRVPLVITGPGVMQNAKQDEYVSHVDLSPTILDLAGVPLPPDWDGRSLKGLLHSNSDSKSEMVLIEYEGEADPLNMGNLFCGAGRTVFDELGRARAAGQLRPALCDSWNNTYACLRGDASSSVVRHEFLFCQFECFAYVYERDELKRRPKRGVKTKVPCPKGSANDVGEFYNLELDPHQLTNRILSLSFVTRRRLTRRLQAMKTCRGAVACAAARNGIGLDDDDDDIWFASGFTTF